MFFAFSFAPLGPIDSAAKNILFPSVDSAELDAGPDNEQVLYLSLNGLCEFSFKRCSRAFPVLDQRAGKTDGVFRGIEKEQEPVAGKVADLSFEFFQALLDEFVQFIDRFPGQ